MYIYAWYIHIYSYSYIHLYMYILSVPEWARRLRQSSDSCYDECLVYTYISSGFHTMKQAGEGGDLDERLCISRCYEKKTTHIGGAGVGRGADSQCCICKNVIELCTLKIRNSSRDGPTPPLHLLLLLSLYILLIYAYECARINLSTIYTYLQIEKYVCIYSYSIIYTYTCIYLYMCRRVCVYCARVYVCVLCVCACISLTQFSLFTLHPNRHKLFASLFVALSK
jgi:hypothetical protein